MPPMIQDDKGRHYHHHSQIAPAGSFPSPLSTDSEDRQYFFPTRKRKLRLNNTAGAYVPLDGRNLLLVIDKNTVPHPSGEWDLIGATAAQLERAFPALSDQAKAALARLRAVIFSSKPFRSYAEVRDDLFFYDTDEFRRRDNSLVTPAWTASCIVHDANHIFQHDTGADWHGVGSETICWQLQVDNSAALGLHAVEVQHLNALIADPQSVIDRLTSRVI
jgi:hypothetical protein